MKAMTILEIAQAINGELVQGEGSKCLNSVSIDTRTLKPGDVFFALRGENFDAHHFLKQAVAAGAGALIVAGDDGAASSAALIQASGPPVIRVQDTLAALQKLAGYNRRQHAVPVIGITGSSGKTTTKDMVASVLEQKYKVLKTSGNFNNEVGLPLTLLQMDDTHQVVVLEMAMRAPGEIAFLAGLASPTGAVITNAGEAHIERLGSRENIARAKGELLDHIPENGFAVIHSESPHLPAQAARCRGKIIFFGAEGDDAYARGIRKESTGNKFNIVYNQEKAEIFVPVAGLHNVCNALAAAVVGKEMGLDWGEISKGLAQTKFSSMRMEIVNAGGVTVINDAYNANPSSATAALHALREMAGQRRSIAVLGNMLELGDEAARGHRKVGRVAAMCAVKYLFTVGDLAEYVARGAKESGMPRSHIKVCGNNQEALHELKSIIFPGDMVLVKGSRGMHMEEIVAGLLQHLEEKVEG